MEQETIGMVRGLKRYEGNLSPLFFIDRVTFRLGHGLERGHQLPGNRTGFPVPIVRPSTHVIGATSAAVPVQIISSAV